MTLSVEFCGERYDVTPDATFDIGREGDLVVDDNRYLHRRFLRIHHDGGFWWLANIGGQLSATVVDETGAVEAWLAPGARIPLVFGRCSVWFSAGPTTYELDVRVALPPYSVLPPEPPSAGTTTTGRLSLTPEQRLLVISLAEPALRAGRRPGRVGVPSSADAAARLGWTVTKLNRKLDNVCDKLDRAGIRGLHGEPGSLATDRKSRLVEHALATRLVTPADLELLATD